MRLLDLTETLWHDSRDSDAHARALAPQIAADSYGREGPSSFVINQRGHFVTT